MNSNHKSRIEKLENIHHIKNGVTVTTWKDFIEHPENVDNVSMALLLGGDNELRLAKEWSETFTDVETAMLLNGDMTLELKTKLDNCPDSLKPVIDELAQFLENHPGYL